MTAENAATFIRGKNATFTVRSLNTDKHYTFQANKSPGQKDIWFIAALVGPDEWSYVGMLTEEGKLVLTKASKFKPDSPVVGALRWVFHQVFVKQEIPESLEIMHEGTCANCGRRLTHPSSLETGFGPECAKKLVCKAA